MEIEIPEHPLCRGGCELTRDRTRQEEATPVVIEMKMAKARTEMPMPYRR